MTFICARIAGMLLVNPHGRLLLQLRDGNTHIDPHRWCLPGGDINPDEDTAAAALRELHEETGLKPDSDVELFWTGVSASARFPGAMAEFFVYCATTSARQEDVVCGEGAAMRFVPVAEVAGLEFGVTYARVVPRFLASPQYRRLAGDHTPAWPAEGEPSHPFLPGEGDTGGVSSTAAPAAVRNLFC